MKFTQHAIKRLALLTMDSHSQMEVLFIHRFILPGVEIIHWNHGLHVDDIPFFAARCHRFGGRMLGLETWLDSPYPLYTFTYQDYSESYTNNWYETTITELKLVKVMDMVIPTVSIPQEVLEQYMG